MLLKVYNEIAFYFDNFNHSRDYFQSIIVIHHLHGFLFLQKATIKLNLWQITLFSYTFVKEI